MDTALKQRRMRSLLSFLQLLLVTVITFCHLTVTPTVYAKEDTTSVTPQILLFHSAHQGYKWTDTLHRSIQNVVNKIRNLSVTDTIPDQYMFNHSQLQQSNVDLEEVSTKSVVINKPTSFYRKNKTLVHVTVACFALLLVLVIALILVIVRLKETNNTLLLSDEIVKRMPDAIILTDPNGKITRWLGNAEQIFGYTEDECKGLPIDVVQSAGLVLPDSPEISNSMLEKGHYSGELICHRKDGATIPTDSNVTQILGAESQVIAHLGIFKDSSERKKAESDLRESRDRCTKMIQKSPLPMMMTDKDQNIVLFNDTFTEQFGYTTDDISLTEDWWSVAWPDPEYREKVKKIWLDATLLAAENDTDREAWEWELTIKDGTCRSCEFYMLPLDDLSLIVINESSKRIATEVEKFKLESRLQQAQKMESIEILARGVAHDFNNTLSAIIGFSEMAMDSCEPESHISKDLHEVIEAGNRAKELVLQIRALGRKNDTDPFAMQSATIVVDIIQFLRPFLPTTIDIVQNIDRRVGLILADPTQIHQILMNLCTNAFHAMEQSGGKLHISLKEVVLSSDDLVHLPDVESGRFIQFAIQDSGEGIAPDIKDKIFDPDFTTRETGRGAGMGLAVVQDIVKKNGGFITCFSETGVGTTFHVFWPVIENDLHHGSPTADEPMS